MKENSVKMQFKRQQPAVAKNKELDSLSVWGKGSVRIYRVRLVWSPYVTDNEARESIDWWNNTQTWLYIATEREREKIGKRKQYEWREIVRYISEGLNLNLQKIFCLLLCTYQMVRNFRFRAELIKITSLDRAWKTTYMMKFAQIRMLKFQQKFSKNDSPVRTKAISSFSLILLISMHMSELTYISFVHM
jgi:hypothetical protein